jgi:hypothetical protein
LAALAFLAALAALAARARAASLLPDFALAVTELLPLLAARDVRADEALAVLRLRADADPVGAFAFLAIAPDPLLLAFFRAAMAKTPNASLTGRAIPGPPARSAHWLTLFAPL